MTIIYHCDIIQGSPEWHELRLGKVTASRVADILAKTKTGPSASRQNYLIELALQRTTKTIEPSYTNAAMEWGTQTEPLARSAYENARNLLVKEVGFINHPRIEMSGASPDGLVADDGLVEIKCPNTATHIDTLLSGKVPTKYITQMQWQMLCCQRKWCDFVSFDNRLPEHLQLFVQEVEFDPEYCAMLEKEVVLFLTELDNKVAKLKEKYE